MRDHRPYESSWHFVQAIIFVAFVVPSISAQQIPEAAWSRGIGESLDNPGVTKVRGNIDEGYWQGVPLGGFGSGSIGRTYRGDFARWHLKTGVHKYQSIASNVFAAFEQSEGGPPQAVVLRAGKPEGAVALSAWNWSYPTGAGKYYALFPKAWFDYESPAFPVHLTCEQFSPVLPNNYKETSYPVGVFVWHAKNTSDKPAKVSVLFSWTNMVGWFSEFNGYLNLGLGSGTYNKPQWEKLAPGGMMRGLVFDRVRSGPAETDADGQFAIAALEDPDVKISYQTTFDVTSDGASVWNTFAQDGTLHDLPHNWLSSGVNPVGGAIAVTFTLAAGAAKDVPMVLAWDFPIVQFGAGRRWYKRYTAFFGTSGSAAWRIARTGLQNWRQWSKAIDEWQRPIVADAAKPLWYRGMLFNELYYLADGGTFWENGEVGKPATGPHHHFSYLECFDYPFYSTLDVRFYASWALLKFWPDLEKEEMRQFADTVPLDYQQYHQIGWDKSIALRKAAGALPHDLGAPIEDPLRRVNQYGYQNVTVWKDLNSKFVLQVYRDFALTGGKDLEFLRATWPAVKSSLDYLKKFDTKGDGLPQNEGIPDQTYDTWRMRGTSAYCGSLWLASLKAAVRMAAKVGDPEAGKEYQTWYDKAQPNFVKELWNGEYFNYDTESPYKSNVMADQLVGQWYANLCGLGEIVPHKMTRKALATVFKLNVLGFEKGEMGAVNGINADGTLIKDNEQTEEVWAGTTLALASFLKSEGMLDEAYKTVWGVHNVVYVKKGYWFRTPEAWDHAGNFRAELYMRPQAIWAMEFGQ
ncbi:MAG: glucosylceramidase [Acidobacteriia bacterium]|nr:glucosylceramidase [Terriglobia bacterium]